MVDKYTIIRDGDNKKSICDMSKYRILVSIDEKEYFWVLVDREMLIKNPTKGDLKGAKLKTYNKTNICPRCRTENNITDKSILYPKNVSRDKTGEWVCIRHYIRDYERHDPDSKNNLMKSLRDRRTGNLNDPDNVLGDNCQELTCRWRGIKDLNKENDNYNSPIDHSRDHEIGIVQTKGRRYDPIQGRWPFGNLEKDHDKDFDFMICWCVSDDGETIERGYIIPKKEIIKTTYISIVKNPVRRGSSITPWYEQYRIKDDNILRKINEIWKEIIKYKKI